MATTGRVDRPEIRALRQAVDAARNSLKRDWHHHCLNGAPGCGSKRTQTAPPQNWIVKPSGEYTAQSFQERDWIWPGRSIQAVEGSPASLVICNSQPR